MTQTIHATLCRDNGLTEDEYPSRRARKLPGAKRNHVSPNARARVFVLLHDPTPRDDGGYRPEIEFERTEIAPMLKNRSFANGTTLNSEGVTYTVYKGYLLGDNGKCYAPDAGAIRLVEVRL